METARCVNACVVASMLAVLPVNFCAEAVLADQPTTAATRAVRTTLPLPRDDRPHAPVDRFAADGAVIATEATAALRLAFTFDSSAGDPPADLLDTPVYLTRATNAWVAPRGTRAERFTLGTLPTDAPFANSAVAEVLANAGARLRARPNSVPVYFVPLTTSVAWTWSATSSLPALTGIADIAGFDLAEGRVEFLVIGPVADPQIDRGVFSADGFSVRAARRFEHPDLPPASAFDSIAITLARTPTGWIQPRVGMPAETILLGELGDGDEQRFHESALAVIAQAVRDQLAADPGLVGHLVRPAADEIEVAWPVPSGDAVDIRPPGRTGLTFEIYSAVVTQTRTIAGGERWAERQASDPDESLINRPEHAHLLNRSPIQPPEGDASPLLANRTLIDRATARFNRHPGRRVDVALAPAGGDGALSLDYLVTENRPWQVYAEATNTGTESTGDIRFRVGFATTQLTDRDDTLRVEYLGADTGETHAVIAAYETPLIHDRLRLRVFGGYNEYTASDVGLFRTGFEGEGWDAGGELILNVLQTGRTFIDTTGGVRVERRSVLDTTFDSSSGVTFLFGTLGIRAERVGPTSSLFAGLTADIAFPGATDITDSELVGLGRTAPSRNQSAIRWDASYSFFLEPLLDPDGFAGRRTPEDQALAHLLTLRVRGQQALNNRLTPTHQQVVGGFATVRGYEESLVASDDAIVLTAEYAFHLARALPSGPPSAGQLFGRDFRYRRATPFGQADWDLILRAFIDAGFTRNSNAFAFEDNESLVGVGVGAEVTLRRNLSARADLGVALSDAVGGGDRVEAGDARLHFAVLLAY